MAEEEMNVVPLYGGAMRIQLPASFMDASKVRVVPDHQEVWVDTKSDCSIIIELLGQEECSDEEAASYFFNDLAESNDAAADYTVLHSELLLADYVPGFPAEVCKAFIVGDQAIAKFKEAAKNLVRIYMTVIRLPMFGTDVLVTMNVPLDVAPESSSAKWSWEPSPDDPEGFHTFRNVLSQFELLDVGLFT
eukprot:PLAT9740.2.p1 GENE.PLAT9740.2~~PLAT9740.2.p1  ORF type:complete len:191 (+),score=75.92 PLAT9740.2:64-636(+)